MLRLVWTFLKGCFVFFCIVGAILMTAWLVYNYTLDEDVSSINFKYYHSSEKEVYPSISMCFAEDGKVSMSKKTEGFNISAYINFLSGCGEELLYCDGCCDLNKEGQKYEKHSI